MWITLWWGSLCFTGWLPRLGAVRPPREVKPTRQRAPAPASPRRNRRDADRGAGVWTL